MDNYLIPLARAFFGAGSNIQRAGSVHLRGQKKPLRIRHIYIVGSRESSDYVSYRRPGWHVRCARWSSTSTVENVAVKHTATGSLKPREVSFPCIDQHEARSANLLKSRSRLPSDKPNAKLGHHGKPMSTFQPLPEGPEPTYSKLVSGYQLYRHSTPFALDYGKTLPQFELAYETWGKLSAAKDNAILLHTGLSASSHAKSHDQNPSPGWWEKFIGNGQSYPIDLDRHFVICTNVLGSCYGSTGPSSNNPSTGEAYATHFPILSIFDMVRAQFKLLDHLGIHKLYASVGSSMGGMQSIAAAWLEPERVGKVVSISGCGRSGPSSIALRYAQRSVLMADPNWNRGFYYDSLPPHTGMKLARQIATITYRSGPEWEQRFGRRRRVKNNEDGRSVIQTPALCPDFLIETYLDHQGEQFCLKYDANSLIYVSKAMDLFDMSSGGISELSTFRAGGDSPVDPPLELDNSPRHVSSLPSYSANIVDSLAATFQMLRDSQKFLILGVQSDILFPISLQRELAEALRQSGKRSVTYYELDSPYGHDTFLIDLNGIGGAIRGFLS